MGVLGLVSLLLQIYYYILLARVILSWTTQFWRPPSALYPVIDVIYRLTEPVLRVVRRYVPPVGGFDLSPLIVFLVLVVIQQALL